MQTAKCIRRLLSSALLNIHSAVDQRQIYPADRSVKPIYNTEPAVQMVERIAAWSVTDASLARCIATDTAMRGWKRDGR